MNRCADSALPTPLHASRARRELDEVLAVSDPTDGLWRLLGNGFFAEWIPEFCDLIMEQDPVHRHKDVLRHSIAVVSQTPTSRRVRMAALLHDIGKPATRRIGPGGVTFRHHEAVGARIAARCLDGLGHNLEFVAEVARLVALSGRFKGYAGGWTDAAVRRYARDAGPLLGDLNDLVRADCTTRNQVKVARLRREIGELEARVRQLAVDDRAARERPPLDGDQVMALLGIEPGPDVDAALDMLGALRDAHDDGVDERVAVEALRRWWERREQAGHG